MAFLTIVATQTQRQSQSSLITLSQLTSIIYSPAIWRTMTLLSIGTAVNPPANMQILPCKLDTNSITASPSSLETSSSISMSMSSIMVALMAICFAVKLLDGYQSNLQPPFTITQLQAALDEERGLPYNLLARISCLVHII